MANQDTAKSESLYIIKKEWDIMSAKYEYRLIKNPSMFYEECAGYGDKEWAEKTAAHFNIDMPDEGASSGLDTPE